MQLVAGVGKIDDIRNRRGGPFSIAFGEEISGFMLITEKACRGCISFSKDDVSHGPKTGIAPCMHEEMHLVPCKKTHEKGCGLENAINFAKGGTQQSRVVVVGDAPTVAR